MFSRINEMAVDGFFETLKLSLNLIISLSVLLFFLRRASNASNFSKVVGYSDFIYYVHKWGWRGTKGRCLWMLGYTVIPECRKISLRSHEIENPLFTIIIVYSVMYLGTHFFLQ